MRTPKNPIWNCTKCEADIAYNDYIAQDTGVCRACRAMIDAFKDIMGIETEQKDMQIMSDEEIFRKYGLEF